MSHSLRRLSVWRSPPHSSLPCSYLAGAAARTKQRRRAATRSPSRAGHGHGHDHGHGHGHGGPPGHGFPGGGHGRGHDVERDDPQPLPRRGPGAGDRRPQPRKPSSPPPGRSCAKSPPTTSRPGPRAWRRRSSPKKPDLVGLQEVALWRTGPPSLAPVLSGVPTATTVRYDYLQLLLDQLNKGPDRYEVVVAQNEFDLEAPGDENGVPGDGPAAQGIPNAEINGRLTMRDVILARIGSGVQTSNPPVGQLQNPAGGADPRPAADRSNAAGRRPTRRSAAATGSASSTPTSRRSTRRRWCRASARCRRRSWSRPAGRRRAACRSSCVGDLNSDDDTVEPGDQQAYRSPARSRAWSSAAPTIRSAAA